MMRIQTIFFAVFVCFLTFACKNPEPESNLQENSQKKFAIAIHGGAGVIKPENMSDSLEQAYKEKLEEAITAGHRLLEEGKSSVEAIKAAIQVMEESPLFNAGKGAVLNHNEKPELDASIMDGKTLNAGAVAGISHIKSPILLAYEIMENSKHVMLSGEGAELFAMEQGLDTVPETYFITKRRLDQVRAMKNQENELSTYFDPMINAEKMGTVGAVALDKDGNLAAGTSTGGMANKRYGRIGDSPIIGAGTYANNKTCAVSATGDGEFYIRGTVAYDVSALMEYKGLSVSEATQKILHEKQPELGGTGGLIAMDKYGNVSLDFNTPGMFRASMDEEGNLDIGIYKE